MNWFTNLSDNTGGNTGVPYAPKYGGFSGSGQTGFETFSSNIGEGFGKIGDVVGSEGFQQGLGAFGTLANMYTGFKALGLAKDQLQFQKKSWNKNYEAQLKDYENTLKDRWTARNAAANARGSTFQGMNEWVGSRMPGG